MTEKKPFFSVVIPLYNKRPHIQRSIGSVLIQTFRYFELIVVDDGSTDGSLDELKDIKDNRLKIFEKENGGASSARNFGIKEAKADYVAFLDADDEWDRAFLETIYEMYKMYPDAGIYTTGCKIVSNSGTQRVKFIKHNEEVFKIEDYFKEFVKLGGPINNSSTSVVKKDSLFTVGLFPENLKNFEDWNVWFKVALVEDVVYSKKILSIIYLNAVNREHHKDSDTNILKAYDKVISDIEKFIQVNKLNRKSIDLLFQTKAQSFINKAIKTKNFEFLNNFKFAIIHNYTNSYQRIIYFTNINRLVYFVYKILSTLGVKR